MNRANITMIILVWLLLVCFNNPVYASTSKVSATVVDQTFNAPVLVAPTNNATINTVRPTFSWLRPSPLPASPLNHYDFYLDDAVFASGLADSLTSVDFYFYSATASAGTFHLSLKTDLTQGYHTWKVVAYSDAGISASSETRTFYLDSTSPLISITSVDTAILTWSTGDPASIPDVQNRYITVTTASPLIKGSVEISANLKITLICPQNIPSCTIQTYTTNSSSGLWEYRFSNLLSGYTYTVKVSATDAAGNSTLFPDFFITYGTKITPTTTITPKVTVTPTVTPIPTLPPASPSAFPTLPLPSTTLTPPPGLLAVITPGAFDYGPPSSPTPPPKKDKTASTNPFDLFYIFLIVLIIVGLPLHLVMAMIGTETPLSFVPKFLFILAFPFLRNKKYRTVPFTFINIFERDKLEHPWQTVVSDIKGYFNLKNPIPENIFISLTVMGRHWKDSLMKGTIIPISCLYPTIERQQDSVKSLRKVVYDARIIPLIIACLTSITVFAMRPSYPIFIYTYFSFQYLFSEYLYPKISN